MGGLPSGVHPSRLSFLGRIPILIRCSEEGADEGGLIRDRALRMYGKSVSA